jgi:phytoene synthase
MAAPSDMLDPERNLALSYVGHDRAQAVRTLWELDTALGQLLIGATSPMIIQMKLAWWRESLARLDREPPSAEPKLQHVARDLLPVGFQGSELAQLGEGWEYLAGSEPLDAAELNAYARLRGGLLFACTARLLAGTTDALSERGGRPGPFANLGGGPTGPKDRRAALRAGLPKNLSV